MNFGSDNTSGVHPKIMDALVGANTGFATSYGDDLIMDRVRQQIRDLFEAPTAAVYLVTTGSAANSLALATYVDAWDVIYCHQASHISNDECGAPEFYSGGARLMALEGENGKLLPETLRAAVQSTPVGDVHTYQRGALSVTNTSEMGTVYTCEEIAALSSVAKEFDLPFHMDGARFANALAKIGCNPAEMTWKSGVDVLSFGGTKNGLMGVEAVIMFDPDKSWEFELRRKRGGHLLSKHRYLSVQMQAYLTNDHWLDTARMANDRAARLAQGLGKIDGVNIACPTDANMLFISATRAKHRAAMAAGAVYSLAPFGTSLEGDDDEMLNARMVCSWSTTDVEIDQLLAVLST